VYAWETVTPVSILITFSALSGAVLDTVVDGLMVSQSRLDPDYGAEDLQTLSWIMLGLGGVLGSVIGGAMT
jgi:hypothetical protein